MYMCVFIYIYIFIYTHPLRPQQGEVVHRQCPGGLSIDCAPLLCCGLSGAIALDGVLRCLMQSRGARSGWSPNCVKMKF